jgi:hypothetical protein
MGPEYDFPVLLYDAVHRELKYGAVDYLELSPDYEKVKKLLIPLYNVGRDTILGSLITDNSPDQRVEELKKDIETIFDDSGVSHSRTEVTVAARRILGAIGQPITTKLRIHIWETWLSLYMKDPFQPASLEEGLKNSISGGKDGREILRDFIEHLFFMGMDKNKVQWLTVVPMGRLGQKLGLMFTMRRAAAAPPSEKVDRDRAIFVKIAGEFSSLLFKSRQHEMYQEALNKMDDHTIYDLPWILLEVFPKCFNIVAGAFWSDSQIRKGDSQAPLHLFAFEKPIASTSSFSESASGRCSADSPLVLRKLNDEEKITIWAREFGGHPGELKDLILTRNKVQAPALHFSPKTGAQIYSEPHAAAQPEAITGSAGQSSISVRGRLLVPMPLGETSDDRLPASIHGVFDLYFDLSPYVLRRHSLDLAREIGFMFTQMANAAKQKQEALTHASKSASTGIMARNLAHNIASHVLSYWIRRMGRIVLDLAKYTEQVGKHVRRFDRLSVQKRKDRLTQFSEKTFGLLRDENVHSKNAENNLNETKALLHYLKQRMDFIAEITTTSPAWEKTFLLKKDILDPFNKQSAIIDNITRSEGFCSACGCPKTRNSQKAESCSGCPRLPAGGVDQAEVSPEEEPEPLEIKYEGPDKDCPVSIPQGTLGKHAFYSILENFIRNSAKHGGRNIRKKIKKDRASIDRLLFTVKLEKPEGQEYEEYVRVTIMDNIGNCNEPVDAPDGKTERVIDKLARAVTNKDYVDFRGRVLRGNWGIKEMKLSANFLRKRDTNNLFLEAETNSNGPLLIELRCYEKCSEQAHPVDCGSNVALSFYLSRPKEVCIVTDEAVDSKIEYGIRKMSREEFSDSLKAGGTIPHRFIVFDHLEDAERATKEYRERLPMRFLVRAAAANPHDWRHPVHADALPFDQIETNPKGFIREVYKAYTLDKVRSGYQLAVLYKKSTLGHKAVEYDNRYFTNRDPGNESVGILDDHSEILDTADERVPKLPFYQGVSGSTSFGKLLEGAASLPKPEDYQTLLWELMEMSLTKVLVVDERIWRNACDARDELKYMGIILFPVKGETITESDGDEILECEDDIAFLVIHKGIIEKMIGGKSFIEKAILKFPYVIIDSGRGEPEDLEPGTRYVPMGAIEEFIADRDKHALIQTLFSLRRTKDANKR